MHAPSTGRTLVTPELSRPSAHVLRRGFGVLGGALPTAQSQYLPSVVFGLVIVVLLIRPDGLFARGTVAERV